ncbi:glycoside hydrolase family 2 protein [Demequina sp. B12]|uniref:glycoside hydrolase family 2 protein n=1 Tax=Demequina sp. B12 TaxID=2992757 RepID=UPI00237BADE5|nr:glycoside hydrolase family 2 protein [Demequina sp. B12]MDE0573590.1 glycoside hydrolase family 2 protein [Demequina sp. B12]
MAATSLSSSLIVDGWTLTHSGGTAPAAVEGATVPADVPGTTHVDLLSAGLIPDPYLSTNEADLAWMHLCQWRYATTFDADPVEPGERVDLVFDGLDTVATVRLNGTEVARTKNMHRSYRFDVRELLSTDSNALEVDFASALEYAQNLTETLGHRPTPYPHPYPAVRKMACSFGWDWGPDLQTAGIWKPVKLERWRTARIDTVRPVVTLDGCNGRVEAHVTVERAADCDLHLHATIGGVEAGATIVAGESQGTVVLEVPDVERWWPRGYGEAHLYDFELTLSAGEGADAAALDSYRTRLGFRTVEVDMSHDGTGAAFTFVVNGEPVFVKGANWIPDDHLLTRITRDRLERRITQATDAHMNLLRIWGGGIYESEDFYELCDEAGVMVWQDFLFACAAYAEGAPLRGEVEAEAREAIVRLMPHASLVLWNGSNENIWGWHDWNWQGHIGGDGTWGIGYYEELLPALVADLDPTRTYTPSSPFSPHQPYDTVHPNDPAWGPIHEWQVWNTLDYTHYGSYVPRFSSEYGFQGPPAWATLTRSIPEEDRHQESAAWLAHQKAHEGNDKLNRGLRPHLPAGRDFEEWHWATQLNQARAIRFAIEHYRSWWPQTAGSIMWQLNDCWPVTSWAAVDGDERLKPLWFALRAGYAPRILTFQPRGADGELDTSGLPHVVAVNDSDEDWDETLTLSRVSLDGEERAVSTVHLAVPARQAVTIPVPSHVVHIEDPARELLVADAGYAGDEDHVRAVWTDAEDKDFAHAARPFTATAAAAAGGYEVTVTAQEFVRDLALLADKVAADAVVSDTLVTLLPDERVTFRIATSADVDPQDFLGERVLVSANSLVAGAHD